MRTLRPLARTLLVLLGACGAAAAGIASDGPQGRRADQLTAAYLFNFVKFIEWPERLAQEPLEFCFIDADGVHRTLEAAAADKRVGARPVAFRTLRAGDSLERCAVVYIDDGAVEGVQGQLDAGNPAALTVSGAHDFTRHGGVIRLFTENNRLRFIINVDNARRAGLRISSNLLKLASEVEEGGGS